MAQEHATPRAMAAREASTSSSVAVDVSRDSCAFYALQPGQRCRQPRSCYDCLNAEVTFEPQGCMVSPYGACESMSAYAPEMDYRENASSTDSGEVDNPRGGWWHAFPSVNSTYCEPQDTACVRCRAIALNASRENSYLVATSKFCLGVGGCVCIVACEAPTWASRVQPDCNATSADPSTVSAVATAAPPRPTQAAVASHDGSHQLVWYLAVAQLPIFTVILVARARWLRYKRAKRKSPPTHQLQLSGWRALHEQLMERDRQRPPHAETVLRSALPPLAPSADDQRPPLMTRTERVTWAPHRGAAHDAG